MVMSHRLQLLLDDDRYQRVSAVAASERRSVASVIRDAIDRSLPTPSTARRAAAAAVLAADPVESPDVATLKAELDEARGRHG